MLAEQRYPIRTDGWAGWNQRAKPRKCEVCGEEYMPKSRSQRFCCKACRELAKKER